MNTPLHTTHLDPLDIGLNVVTKNCVGSIKVHLQNPQRNRLALLWDNQIFAMEMKNREMVIEKIEEEK